MLDGAGAALSALFLGVALPALQEWIGMPTRVLYALALIAALFALNAGLALRFAGPRAATWLRTITYANLCYCCLTGGLVVLHFAALTPWGVAYFLGEIGIILALVALERRALRSAPSYDSAHSQ